VEATITSTAVKLSEFEAMSFDCYGTLIDWEAGISSVLGPWARAKGLDISDEKLLTAYSNHEVQAEEEHPDELYPGILARSMIALGHELEVETTPEEARRLAMSVPDWPAFSDSRDALVSLGKRLKLIIVSNVDNESFSATNRRLGIEFDAVLTAEEIGSYKPSARNFVALLDEVERLGVGHGKLLHVAQSLFHDHVPAKEIGLHTVWINRRHGRSGWGATPAPSADVTPDWEFPSMAAFAAAAGDD